MIAYADTMPDSALTWLRFRAGDPAHAITGISGTNPALWIAAWNLGIVRERPDAALLSVVRRQPGKEPPRFPNDCPVAIAHRVWPQPH